MKCKRIYPYLKNLEKINFAGRFENIAFTFKFDECPTQQVKNQYDKYVQCWPNRYNCIKTVNCGTIMVDQSPSQKLLEHFLEFVNKFSLELKLMPHIGTDESSVNLKFEDFLKSSQQIKTLDSTILSIGKYSLHFVHNAFRAGVNALNFSIDSFVIDLNFFSGFLLPEEQTTNTCRNLPRLFITLYRNIPAQDGLERYVFRYWNNTKTCENTFWNSS